MRRSPRLAHAFRPGIGAEHAAMIREVEALHRNQRGSDKTGVHDAASAFAAHFAGVWRR